MNHYAGVYIIDGKVGRLTFEAASSAQATELAVKWGVGLEGEAVALESPTALPEAYDAKTACRLLGGISRTTLYKELVIGNLDRVPNTRRVLVTRKSIEKRCRG